MPREAVMETSTEIVDPGFRMENNAPRGTKVRVVQVTDRESYSFPNANKLKLGDVLTVYATCEAEWHTLVYVEEFYNKEFNSVHFVEEERYQDFIQAEVAKCPRCDSTAITLEVNENRTVYKQNDEGYWYGQQHDLFGMDEVHFDCDSCGNSWDSHKVPKGFRSKSCRHSRGR